MLPFIYIVALCTLILFRRDIQTVGEKVFFFVFILILGLDNVFCGSEICDYSLKRSFKQARPERNKFDEISR